MILHELILKSAVGKVVVTTWTKPENVFAATIEIHVRDAACPTYIDLTQAQAHAIAECLMKAKDPEE